MRTLEIMIPDSHGVGDVVFSCIELHRSTQPAPPVSKGTGAHTCDCEGSELRAPRNA